MARTMQTSHGRRGQPAVTRSRKPSGTPPRTASPLKIRRRLLNLPTESPVVTGPIIHGTPVPLVPPVFTEPPAVLKLSPSPIDVTIDEWVSIFLVTTVMLVTFGCILMGVLKAAQQATTIPSPPPVAPPMQLPVMQKYLTWLATTFQNWGR